MIVRNGKTTHLIGRDISYIMFENEDGDLLNFHFGKKIADIDYSQMKEEWEEKSGGLFQTDFVLTIIHRNIRLTAILT